MIDKFKQKPHIIIDTGTGYCKSGFSTEEYPSSIIPCLVGHPKYSSGRVGFNKKKFYVGSEASSINGVLNINNPLPEGVVTNWDDMEKMLGFIFSSELKVDTSEYNVLLTETPMNPKENKEKLAQIMFENFNVQGLYIALESVLALFGAGKDTGISVDLGDGISHFVPIYYGCCLPHAMIRINLGGKDLTEYMSKLLENKGDYNLNTIAGKEIIKDIKENACYIANNYDEEIKNLDNYLYELPDGNKIELIEERIKCPEVLFDPKIIYKDEKNISQNCYEAIEKCDNDIKKEIYKCIVLSGGTSMFKGLEERFCKEIKNLMNNDNKSEVKIETGNDKKYGVWIGGAMLSMSGFDLKWITKAEYEESGDLIIHKKCI